MYLDRLWPKHECRVGNANGYVYNFKFPYDIIGLPCVRGGKEAIVVLVSTRNNLQSGGIFFFMGDSQM